MVSKRFQDLNVYRLAEELSEEIWQIVSGWQPLAIDTVGKQIIRSADSIGANRRATLRMFHPLRNARVAEGVGRGSFNDNKRFVRIARGSLYETQHWLRRAYCRKLLTQQQLNKLKPLIDKLAPKLNAYLNSIGKV